VALSISCTPQAKKVCPFYVEKPRVVREDVRRFCSMDDNWKIDLHDDFAFINTETGVRFRMDEAPEEVLKRLGPYDSLRIFDPRYSYGPFIPSGISKMKTVIEYQYFFGKMILQVSEVGPELPEKRVGHTYNKISYVFLDEGAPWITTRGVGVGDPIELAIARYHYTKFRPYDWHAQALEHWPVIKDVIKPLIYPFLEEKDIGTELWHLINMVIKPDTEGWPEDTQNELIFYAEYDTGIIIGLRASN
jgi:hypothetical protein